MDEQDSWGPCPWSVLNGQGAGHSQTDTQEHEPARKKHVLLSQVTLAFLRLRGCGLSFCSKADYRK